MSKTYSKRQNLVQNKNIDVHNLENIGSPLWCFSIRFFRHYATFFEVSWIPPKGLPFVCFNILQHNGFQKVPNGPLLHFSALWHCSKISFSKFFGNFLKFPKGPALFFFHILQPLGVSQSPKGSPFIIFSRRFRRKSRLLQWLVFFSSVQRVTSTFCALIQLMHIYQLLPYVLNTSFPTHPKRVTWEKASPLLHFRHYATYRKLQKKISKKFGFFFLNF